jgi:HAMP domain-containing protein
VTKQNDQHRSLLQYAGLFFCFFFFPVFVINTSLGNLLEIRRENHRHQVFADLESRLKKLATFNDERRYFHLMLNKVFSLADAHSKPLERFADAIDKLKKNHPQQLEFIVWDSAGQIVEHLTDEKRFRFVSKKLWSVLSAVTDHINSGDITEIKEIPEVKTNLNLIRHFLGRVFLPETLRMPYQDDENASVILSDYGKNRPYFWYHTGRSGSMLCFISWEAVKGTQGLRNIVNVLNRNSSDIVTGFASLHNLSDPYLERNRHIKNEITLALAKYENASEQMIETENAQIVVQMLNPHTRIFACQLKNKKLFSPDMVRAQFLCRFIFLYLLGYAILYFNFRVRQAFFSIRWKLLLLFLYANMSPLFILGTIAHDYLQNKTIALQNDIQLESARLLRDIDNRFSTRLTDYENRLNTIILAINKELQSTTLSSDQLQTMHNKIKAFRPSECFIIDDQGNTILAADENGKSVSHSVSYVKNIADAILKFHNRIIIDVDKSDVLTKISAPEHSDFVRNSLRDSRKLWPISIGDVIKLGYWNTLGDQQRYANRYFLMLLWNENIFQGSYLQQILDEISTKKPDRLLFARVKRSLRPYPEPAFDSREIESLLGRTYQTGSAINALIDYGKNRYVATAMQGKKINQTSIAALYPQEAINREIAGLRLNLFAVAILSLLLTITISMAFAKQFLEPVKTLGTAVKAIAAQDFRHRIDTRDNDEFGHLGQLMNRMIEGLGELEIARIVRKPAARRAANS